MKRLLLSLLVVLGGSCLCASAQANIAGTLYASNFAAWSVPQGNAGPYSWSSASICRVGSVEVVFQAFKVGTPVLLVDVGTPSNSEVVTPTQVNNNGPGCSITIAPVHPHTSFYFTSATAGLQEALNYSIANGLNSVVQITPAWSVLGGTTSTVTVTAQGNAAISILDGRTSVLVPYTWNTGTGHYVASPFAGSCLEDTCVLNAPVATQTVAQPAGTTLASNSINNVISIVPGTAISTMALAITACGSANTTIQITQTIAVGSGITVPANCTLLFQSAGNLTGTSITINGGIQAASRQIFGAGLAVTLGPATTKVPIEWFGGAGDDPTGAPATGTDNLAAFNAAHTALSAGCIVFAGKSGYRFSGTASITKVNICVEGQTVGYPATAASISANSSNLWIDSASATGIDFTSTATWGIARWFALLRTQTPTGTAKGIAVEAGGVIVENVTSEDHIYPMYFHGANGYGTGLITNVSVGWGYTGLAGTPSPAVCGFFVDSSGGVESASIRFFYDSVSSNLAGAGTTSGLCASGTNVSDLYTFRFETSGTNHGIDVESTGTLNGTSQDILFVDSILNTCLTDCMKINGVGATADIGPHVYITGGNFFATGTSAVGALIENSSNVSMTNVQVFAGGTTQTDISLISVDGFQINDNQMDGESLNNVSCATSTHGTINNNQIKTFTAGTGIKNVSCTDVAEIGNTLAGNTGNMATGMSFDAASSNNGPWSLNNIDSATVTTPVSDAGTNNNPALIAGTNITITGKWPNQTINASTSGSMTWPATPGIAVCTGTPCTAWATSKAVPAGTVVGTSDTQALTNKDLTGAGNTFPTFNQNTTGTAAGLAGGATGSAPYQSAASATAFITSPTTTGHTFFYAWQPSGSAIAPIAIDAATWLASTNVVTSVSSLSATNTVPKSGGSGGIRDLQPSLLIDTGITMSYTGAGGIQTGAFTGSLNSCADTSASGTAQTCSLAATFVLTTNTCFAYTTTTANTGTGLTLNVNSTGVKSIAIPGASGWTTTLFAGVIPANKSVWVCYDGTNLDVQQVATLTGSMMASNTVTATQLAAQYSKGSCTEAWGGSGTSHALTSGDDAVVNNTCYNDSGVTRTITAVKCRNDNASNTTTVNPTFGSAGTGTTILSGALTCGNSYAYSSTGTVSNASWTTGMGIDPAQGGTLTGTSIAVIVEYTY